MTRRAQLKHVAEILEITEAALNWWVNHRPIGWTATEHFETPSINCTDEKEKRLARAVAFWAKKELQK